MITIRTKKIFQDTIGDGDLLPNLPEKFRKVALRERIFVPIVYSVLLFSVILSSSINFVLNIREDLIRACVSLLPAIGQAILLAVYWHFLVNRSKFYSLFNEVEDIVYESAQNFLNFGSPGWCIH